MNKILKILIVSVVSVAAVVGIYAHFNAQYPHSAKAGDGSDAIAVFPLKSQDTIVMAGNVMFRIDTGSPVSLLAPEDVDRLRANGAEITEEWFPSLGRDVFGDMFFTDKRYRVNMPVVSNVLVRDTLGVRYVPTGRKVNVIEDMIFLPGNPGQASVIGTDVLECFIVEYRHENNAIAFYNSRPQGYKRLTDLHRPKISNRIIGCGGQYYIDVTTESNTKRYILDTGIDYVHIRLPLCDTLMVKAPLHAKTYTSSRGTVNAKYIENAWVKVGNRVGSHEAYYASDGEEDYAFNPITFFDQDLLIDFSGRALYIRPHTGLASRR